MNEEEEKKKNCFLMFYDWEPLLRMLPKEEVGSLLLALYDYEIREEQPPEGTLSPQAANLFVYLAKLFNDNKKLWYDKRKAGSKGGKKSAENKQSSSNVQADPEQTSSKGQAEGKQSQPKDKDKDKDKDKGLSSNEDKHTDKANKSPTPRFVPPTVEEVRAYCIEKGYDIDPEYFVSYYESQNWRKANGQKVSNWRRCLTTWTHKDKEKQNVSKAPTTPITPKKSNAELFDELYKEAAIYDGQNNGSNTPAFFPNVPGAVQ